MVFFNLLKISILNYITKINILTPTTDMADDTYKNITIRKQKR